MLSGAFQPSIINGYTTPELPSQLLVPQPIFGYHLPCSIILYCAEKSHCSSPDGSWIVGRSCSCSMILFLIHGSVLVFCFRKPTTLEEKQPFTVGQSEIKTFENCLVESGQGQIIAGELYVTPTGKHHVWVYFLSREVGLIKNVA